MTTSFFKLYSVEINHRLFAFTVVEEVAENSIKPRFLLTRAGVEEQKRRRADSNCRIGVLQNSAIARAA